MITKQFMKELTSLINSHSIDTLMGMPDHLIASNIVDYLDSLQRMLRADRIAKGQDNSQLKTE